MVLIGGCGSWRADAPIIPAVRKEYKPAGYLNLATVSSWPGPDSAVQRNLSARGRFALAAMAGTAASRAHAISVLV